MTTRHLGFADHGAARCARRSGPNEYFDGTRPRRLPAQLLRNPRQRTMPWSTAVRFNTCYADPQPLSLSIHGVGLSIGGESPLVRRISIDWRRCCDIPNRSHFRNTAWHEPRRRVSTTLAGAVLRGNADARLRSHRPRPGETLAAHAAENPATYVEFAASNMSRASSSGASSADRLRPAARRRT